LKGKGKSRLQGALWWWSELTATDFVQDLAILRLQAFARGKSTDYAIKKLLLRGFTTLFPMTEKNKGRASEGRTPPCL
jgi:hypothetical protein